MHTEIIQAADPGSIQLAVQVLQQGELVAFPTDTVYGVGCLAADQAAIARLFMVKQRDQTRAFPVLLGENSQLAQVSKEMNKSARRLVEAFWPGALTLVVPRHPSLPELLSPTHTIGVRMPDHNDALNLLQRSGPMAVTSANISGAPEAHTAQQVYDQLGGRIPLILDGGRTPGGVPSTVVDCTLPKPEILRQGPISLDELLQALR